MFWTYARTNTHAGFLRFDQTRDPRTPLTPAQSPHYQHCTAPTAEQARAASHEITIHSSIEITIHGSNHVVHQPLQQNAHQPLSSKAIEQKGDRGKKRKFAKSESENETNAINNHDVQSLGAAATVQQAGVSSTELTFENQQQQQQHQPQPNNNKKKRMGGRILQKLRKKIVKGQKTTTNKLRKFGNKKYRNNKT